ncbi:DUF1631 family protein [Thermomonas sp. HDW16]|uniref:DUF1631 family protein n=1 Tax=Thermomonas sp. HDW16 TaxID=2714945 RepID=UPI00140DFD49|nr:DUF1631 family protein [Thermomonas sp. HDW16]QIL19883.1 DUF1631 domain-containing protein [Thermomonas sp. HDW16]
MSRIADALGTLMVATGSTQFSPRPKTLASATFPRRVKRALENMLTIANTDLQRQMQTILQEAEQDLARQIERAQNPQVRDLCTLALRRLRDGASRFTPEFLGVIEENLAGLHPQSRRPDIASLQAPNQGLSLVDDEHADEYAVLYDLSARHEVRNSLALQLMGQRFGVLAGSPAFDAEHLPFGPYAFGDALHLACVALSLPLEARLSLYHFYDKTAMAYYSTLLEALNARLADDGVLPNLSFVPVRVRPASDDGPQRGTNTRIAAAATSSASSSTGNGDVGNFAGNGHSPAGGASGFAATARNGFIALQGLLAKRRTLLAKLRPGSTDERAREALPATDVLSALKRLRGANPKQTAVADIRQSLLAQARQAHGYGVKLVEADDDSFELLDMLHSQLSRDLRPGTPGDALVQRLRMPLLQLALRDHNFFVDPAHPARMLLDAVSTAGARWSADDDFDAPMLDLLRHAVETVLQDPDAGPETFAAANNALQTSLQSQARKTEIAERRQVDAARGRDKLELARLHANDEIADIVAGRTLPKFSATLFEQAWTDAMTLSLLRSGADSDAWRKQRAITTRLVDACINGGTDEVDPVLLSHVQETLGQVGYHDDDAAVIARMLVSGRSDDNALVSRTELIMQLKSRARLGEQSSLQNGPDRAPRTPAEQAAWERLCALPEGSWIEIVDAAENTLRRVKLAWLSTKTGQTLLLNKRGQRVQGGDLDTLARQFARGGLRVVDDNTGPAEIAWQGMLANLHRIAGSDPGRSDGT